MQTAVKPLVLRYRSGLYVADPSIVSLFYLLIWYPLPWEHSARHTPFAWCFFHRTVAVINRVKDIMTPILSHNKTSKNMKHLKPDPVSQDCCQDQQTLQQVRLLPEITRLKSETKHFDAPVHHRVYMYNSPSWTASRYCPLWTFPFGLPLKILKRIH